MSYEKLCLSEIFRVKYLFENTFLFSIHFFISSIFAVVGVASFAQWSILSNVTAGIIIFFSYPFKIGDKIKVHDKEHPVEGEIYDIKAFYMVLKSEDGELITYPNTLIMQKGVSVIYITNLEKVFFVEINF